MARIDDDGLFLVPYDREGALADIHRYCVPGPNNRCRMMPKLGAPCPLGWMLDDDGD